MIDPSLSLGPGLAPVILAGAVIVTQPWRLIRAGRATVKPWTGKQRIRAYGLSAGMTAIWALLVAAIVALNPGIDAGDVGLAWPHGPHARLTVIAAGVLAALLVTNAVVWAARRKAAPEPPASLARYIPATPRQRIAAVGMIISASLGEEAIYRGFAVAMLITAGLPLLAAAAAAWVVFVVSHAYQGWKRTASMAVPAAVLMVLYVATGSLLPVIIVHAASNGMMLASRPETGETSEPAPATV